MSELRQGDEVTLASGRSVVLTFVSERARWSPVETPQGWGVASDRDEAGADAYLASGLDAADAMCLANLLDVAGRDLARSVSAATAPEAPTPAFVDDHSAAGEEDPGSSLDVMTAMAAHAAVRPPP